MQSFEYACRLARDLGFDGKSLVHPFQLPYCNDAFTPKPHDLAAATELIEALEEARREGRGMVVVNGRLIEHHHLKAARRLLALADMIKSLEAGQSAKACPCRPLAPARRLLLRGLRARRALRPRDAAHHHRRRRAPSTSRSPARAARCTAPSRSPARSGIRRRPLDDLLVFHVAFGKTVPPTSRSTPSPTWATRRCAFLEPVYAGDTISAQIRGDRARSRTPAARAASCTCARARSTSTAAKCSRGRAGSWSHKRDPASPRARRTVVPDLPKEVAPARASRSPPSCGPRRSDPRPRPAARGVGRLRARREPSTIPAR